MPPKRQNLRQSADHAKKIAIQLQVVTQRVARGDDFAPAELTALQELIATLPRSSTARGERLSYFLTVKDNEAVSLLTLYGLALRRSGSSLTTARSGDGAHGCYLQLRKTLATSLSRALCFVTTPVIIRQLLFLDLLLRTHVLRCYGSLLNEAAQLVQRSPSRRNVEAADELLIEAVQLLGALAVAAVCFAPWDANPAFGTGDLELLRTDRVRTQGRLMESLTSEVASAGLLDAWAGCFMHLLASGEWSQSRATKLMTQFAIAVSRNPQYLLLPAPLPPGPLAVLLTAHVVRLVSLCDGGTLYGLPDALLAVPVWCARDGAPMGSSGGDVMSTELMMVVLAYWTRAATAAAGNGPRPAVPVTAAAAALPPFHPAATLDICVRVLNALVDAGGASPAAVSEQRRGQPVPTGTGRLALERAGRGRAADMTLRVAKHALSALFRGGRRPMGQRPEDAGRLRAFWDAYVRVLIDFHFGLPSPSGAAGSNDGTAACSQADLDDTRRGWAGFIVVIMPQLSREAGGLPIGLGPHAKAFLAAGAIPLMERLVRHAALGVTPLSGDGGTWQEILMYGPVGPIAALITSVSKRIAAAAAAAKAAPANRPCAQCVHINVQTKDATAAPAAAATGFGLPEAIIMGSVYLEKMVNWDTLRRLLPVLAETEAAAASGGAASGARQWVTLASFAVMRLLPPLVRALRQLSKAAATAGATGSRPPLPGPCSACQGLLLSSMRVMLECVTMPLQAAPRQSPPASAAAQWRRQLLQDADLLCLLCSAASVLRTLDDKQVATWVACKESFVEALRWVCGVFPQELAEELAEQLAGTSAGSSALTPDVVRAALRLDRPHLWDRGATADVDGPLGDLWGPQAPGPETLEMAALLPSPDELRRRMAPHCCANPGCANLEGPSESALPRRRCGGGPWWYCSKDCQVAHLRAGHKEECSAAAAAATAAVASGAWGGT